MPLPSSYYFAISTPNIAIQPKAGFCKRIKEHDANRTQVCDLSNALDHCATKTIPRSLHENVFNPRKARTESLALICDRKEQQQPDKAACFRVLSFAITVKICLIYTEKRNRFPLFKSTVVFK